VLLLRWVLDVSNPRWVVAAVLLGVLFCDSIRAFAQGFTEPTGDLFEASGNTVIAEKYLDITEVELVLTGSTYMAHLKMADSLPISVSASLSIEWGMLIDSDRDPGTTGSGRWPLIDNGITVDTFWLVGSLVEMQFVATDIAGLVATALVGLVYLFSPMLLISTLLLWRLRSTREKWRTVWYL